MGLLRKIAHVFYGFSYFTFFGILFTILKPFGKARNEPLRKKARQLNIQAAKNLQCGANSVMTKLASGTTLHVVEAGDRNAKLVVLLHGFPDCWHSWSGVIPALVKQGYFVVAPDMRGYNLSDKPQGVQNYNVGPLATDVKELIEHYQKKTATVVAHDWGGVVAWAFAHKHPELLDKLVILNAPHSKAYQREARKNFNQLLSSWYIFFFQIPFLAESVITYLYTSDFSLLFSLNPFFLFLSLDFFFFLTPPKYYPLESVKTFFITKKKDALSAEDKELLACSYAQEGALAAMLNYYKALFRGMIFNGPRKAEGKRDKPQKIQTPTLVLWGQNDVALVPECAMCAEYVENVQVIYIPNCSHWVPYEAPEIVSREIIKFIA